MLTRRHVKPKANSFGFYNEIRLSASEMQLVAWNTLRVWYVLRTWRANFISLRLAQFHIVDISCCVGNISFFVKKDTRMKENKLIDLSIEFSIAVIELCDNIKGHRSMADQLERAANILR